MAVVMLLVVFALSEVNVKSCSENEFELPDGICCPLCGEGQYVAKNCSKEPSGFSGVSCRDCSVCADDMQMIAPCTTFSNTTCVKKELPLIRPPSLCELVLYTIPPVVFIMIIAVIAYKLCAIQNTSHDPAAKPLKIPI